MTPGPVFTSRLSGRQLLDSEDQAIGRDRASIERDREVAARTQADTEFLARELAAVRLALADVVTTQDLDDRLTRLEKLLLDGPAAARGRMNSHPARRDH